MEALGVVSSVIAVVELSVKVVSLCLQYSRAVKHAKNDIFRLRRQVTELGNVSASLEQLLNGPKGAKLKASMQVLASIHEGQSQLQGLHGALCPKTARQAMNRLGMSSLKWSFQSKDVEKAMQVLRHCTEVITLTLQIDQTYVLTFV